MAEKPPYKLRIKDFIPVRGLSNYKSRNPGCNESAAPGTLPRMAVLMGYTALWEGALFGASLFGLGKLLFE